MSGAFSIGAVLHWEAFAFRDGEQANKYLVVLGAKQGADYLFVVATSKQKQRQFQPGCTLTPFTYFFIPGGGKDFFPKDTWLLLDEPYQFSAAEVTQAGLKGLLVVKTNLRVDLANAARNCMKRSKDVAQVYLELL
jgi:hypothetical protein